MRITKHSKCTINMLVFVSISDQELNLIELILLRFEN